MAQWQRFALFALLALVTALGPPTASAQGADLTITIGADGNATLQDPQGIVLDEEADPRHSYTWRLNLAQAYTIVEVRSGGAFDVERPKQVVPRQDGEYFAEVTGFDVSEVDAPARVLRVEGNASTFMYRLGLPGPSESRLTLDVDERAPAFTVGAVRDVTHRSFYVETSTDEPTLARLFVRPAAGGDAVEHPTPNPALLQRFPVQGLRAETAYEVWIVFKDWSGNVATSDAFNVMTVAEPARPTPRIVSVEPAPSGEVLRGPVTLRVAFESPESAVPPEGVRLFFDKNEVTSRVQLRLDDAARNGTLTFVLDGPLEPRNYSASVEITNEAGGTAVERWSFRVASGESSAPGPTIPATLLVLAALAGSMRRRWR